MPSGYIRTWYVIIWQTDPSTILISCRQGRLDTPSSGYWVPCRHPSQLSSLILSPPEMQCSLLPEHHALSLSKEVGNFYGTASQNHATPRIIFLIINPYPHLQYQTAQMFREASGGQLRLAEGPPPENKPTGCFLCRSGS